MGYEGRTYIIFRIIILNKNAIIQMFKDRLLKFFVMISQTKEHILEFIFISSWAEWLLFTQVYYFWNFLDSLVESHEQTYIWLKFNRLMSPSLSVLQLLNGENWEIYFCKTAKIIDCQIVQISIWFLSYKKKYSIP